LAVWERDPKITDPARLGAFPCPESIFTQIFIVENILGKYEIGQHIFTLHKIILPSGTLILNLAWAR
jgi:hypothetical protein